jgi:two-component system phosphate regulon sensor histidine kinase PhoR
MNRRFHWQTTLPIILTTMLSVWLVGFLLAERAYTLGVSQSIFRAEDLTTRLAADFPSTALDDPLALENWFHNLNYLSNWASYHLLDAEGSTVLKSSQNVNLPAPSGNEPEIVGAMQGNVLTDLRTSTSDDFETLFIAAPIQTGNEIIAILQGAFKLEEPRLLRSNLRWLSLIAALLAGLFSLFVTEWLLARLFIPIRTITLSAQEIAQTDKSGETGVYRDDLAQLTHAFNAMSHTLHNQIEALQTERSKLATVLQQMTDGVMSVGADGQVQMINQATATLFGFNENHALGRGLAEVVRDHRLVELWETCQKSGLEQSTYLEFRFPVRVLHCIAIPMQSIQPGQVLLLFQDLTRIRQLETVRRDFISNISHELRTPLASLKALAETLQDGALDDPPAARHFISRMETEVDALSQMVSELLELSRIESGKVPLQKNSVNPCELLAAAQERMSLQAERQHLEVTLNCADDLPPILADAPRIIQVIVNLLHNAIKFTPPGGKINLTAVRKDDFCVFSVSDTGVGIPAEELPRIFERFYKADRARSGGGTGLGLAISRHMVEAHEGQIWVESEEAKGSTFYFSIPIASSIDESG